MCIRDRYDIVAPEYGNMTIEEIIQDNLDINKGAKREDIIKQLISANIIKAK